MLNVAIIGAGIGREHLDGYLELPDLYKVSTICDIDEARALEIIGNNAGIKAETEFNNILKDNNIDLIDICLPPHLHFKMSMDALAAGKHVICEKPLVTSLREADQLIAQTKKYDRVLTPVFQYRFGPATTKLKALMEAGLTGRPFAASLETHWHRDAEYYANPWRGTWKGEQGGAVLGHAIHNHDLLCAILGPIKNVSAFTNTLVNDIETEDCAAIAMHMENGAMATSSITLGAATDTTRLRFCFENITAESGDLPYAPANSDWKFIARGALAQSELNDFIDKVPPQKVGFAGFFEALHDRLNQGVENRGNNSVSIFDGRRSLELVSAIYQSVAKAKPIALPLGEDDEYYNGWTPEQLT